MVGGQGAPGHRFDPDNTTIEDNRKNHTAVVAVKTTWGDAGFGHNVSAALVWIPIDGTNPVGTPKLRVSSVCMHNNGNERFNSNLGDYAYRYYHPPPEMGSSGEYEADKIDTKVLVGPARTIECIHGYPLTSEDGADTPLTYDMVSDPDSNCGDSNSDGIQMCPIAIETTMEKANPRELHWNTEAYNNVNFELIGATGFFTSDEIISPNVGTSNTCAGTGKDTCDDFRFVATKCDSRAVVKATFIVDDIDAWAVHTRPNIQPTNIDLALYTTPRSGLGNGSWDLVARQELALSSEYDFQTYDIPYGEVKVWGKTGGDMADSARFRYEKFEHDKIYAFVVHDLHWNNRISVRIEVDLPPGAPGLREANVAQCPEAPPPLMIDGNIEGLCSIRGWVEVLHLHRERQNDSDTSNDNREGVIYKIYNLTTSEELSQLLYSDDYLSTTNGAVDKSEFDFGYPEEFKNDPSDPSDPHGQKMRLELRILNYTTEVNQDGGYQLVEPDPLDPTSYIRIKEIVLNPWDVATDMTGDDDHRPEPEPDCHGTDPPKPCPLDSNHPWYPQCNCENPNHPDYDPRYPTYPCEPTIQPCGSSPSLFASEGTSFLGDNFPVFVRISHTPDAERLYQFEYRVSGPGLNDSGSARPEAQPETVFRALNTSPPGADMHDYTWDIDWEYNVPVEQFREGRWLSWRTAHIAWGPVHRNWRDVLIPHWANVLIPAWQAAEPQPGPQWDYNHPHCSSCNCWSGGCAPDGQGGSICWPGGCSTCCTDHTHNRFAEVHAAWRASKPPKPIEPIEPIPPRFPSPNNPVGDRTGQVYNSSYDGATYTGPSLGLFGDNFPYCDGNPDLERIQEISNQLVITPPICSSVGGFRVPVGVGRKLTEAIYFNPNAPPEASKMYATQASFEIPEANYHALVIGNSSPSYMLANATTTFDGSIENINLPGDYQANWTIVWELQWGHATSEWGEEINYIGTYDLDCNSIGSPIRITAEPPTCRVRFWEHEVELLGTPSAESKIQIQVQLTNPNAVPIAVNTADYTITGITSGSALDIVTPPPPSSIPIHNPIYSSTTYPDNHSTYTYISDGDTITIYSDKHPWEVPEQYIYSWSIETFLGIERWDTASSSSSHPHAGELIRTDSNGSCSNILRLAYLPYIKAYEGGVAAGGRFGTGIGYDACDGNTSIIGTKATPPILALGQIFGFRKADGDDSAGASSEYALRAFGQITGYYSASQRDDYGQIPNGFNQPHLGLSFANNNSLDDGGNYGAGTHPMDSFANRRCIAHYWSTFEHARAQITDIATSPLDISDDSLVPAGSKLYHDGDLTIFSNNNTDPEINTAIFTEGDLYITSDIYNNERAVWHSTNRLGVSTIYLITKGNVFIDKDVRRIDAIIIALPDNDPTTDGTVYTCSDTSQTRIFSNHHRVCSKQLTINGAVIARSILLGRTNGSRNLGHPFEHPQPSLQANPTVPNADNVAEIFYFSPEYYVALPVASFIESQVDPNQYYRSDSIISLPPLF